MTTNLTNQQLANFTQKFGQPHLDLVRHAAFPMALTPDLLYRLWAHFRCDGHDQLLHIPWVAVADVILAPFCHEVGADLYEIDADVRDALLDQLKADVRFGPKRLQELADFLLMYHDTSQLRSDDPDLRELAQVQRWTALAQTNTDKVVPELAHALLAVPSNHGAEWARIAALLERLHLSNRDAPTLLHYAKGMAELAHGETQSALRYFRQLPGGDRPRMKVAGVTLPVPEEVQCLLQKSYRQWPISKIETASPVAKSDLPESPSLTQALPFASSFIRENSEDKPEQPWRVSFTVSLIALSAFIVTVISGVFAYQYLWKGGFRELAIALQPVSFPPNANEFMNELVIYLQELNREGESSGHRAWRLYTEDGDIEGAIEELRKVDLASSEYAVAQERLAVWPKAFEKNQQNLALSQIALNDSKLTEAENYAKALDSTQPYWRNHQQELLNSISQERARIARQSHRVICGIRNQGTTLSQFQFDAQGNPITDASGEFDLVQNYSLSEGIKVALIRSSANSQMSNLDLSFVEVQEGSSLGTKGWVDSTELCRLSD